MRYILLFAVFFIYESHGALKGSGTASIGVSQLKDDTEVGADLMYELSSDSAYQETDVSIFTEYTSSDSDVQLFNDHRRLYDSDLTSVSVSNRISIIPSLLSWSTDSNIESQESTLTSVRSEDWFWESGPQIKKYIRRDLYVETDASYGESKQNDLLSRNAEGELRISKDLSTNKVLGMRYNHLCWNYDDSEAIDNCNISYGISLNYNTRNSVVDLSVGESMIDTTKTTIYGLNVNYNINSKDSLVLNATKENGNLKSRLDFVGTDNLDPALVTVEMQSIEYVKQISRTSVSIFYEESHLQTEQADGVTEKIKNIDVRYLLSDGICRSCSLLISETVTTQEGLKSNLLAVGIEYPISRNTLANLTVRHSKDEIFGEYNSLNFQIRYNGMDQQLMLD
jgi:hypothetical protein